MASFDFFELGREGEPDILGVNAAWEARREDAGVNVVDTLKGDILKLLFVKFRLSDSKLCAPKISRIVDDLMSIKYTMLIELCCLQCLKS